MAIPKDLATEYENTILEVNFGEFWESVANTSFTGHVITGWNPKGELQTSEDNRLCNERLEELLTKSDKVFWPCTGRNIEGTWLEEGFAIEGFSDDEALNVGRKFKQLAIFKCVSGKKTVLDCTS